MKKCLSLLLASFTLASTVTAQDVEKPKTKVTGIEKPARDMFMLQFTYEGWVKPDSIKTTGIGRGVNVYLAYDFPLGKSHFSFATGIGVGTSNIYLKDQEVVLTRSEEHTSE